MGIAEMVRTSRYTCRYKCVSCEREHTTIRVFTDKEPEMSVKDMDEDDFEEDEEFEDEEDYNEEG
jgi:wyosine [tRNA(Phe)-imidazoG37] synthetase (radical SAM superfamily)